jgi:hypothetical protein
MFSIMDQFPYAIAEPMNGGLASEEARGHSLPQEPIHPRSSARLGG